MALANSVKKLIKTVTNLGGGVFDYFIDTNCSEVGIYGDPEDCNTIAETIGDIPLKLYRVTDEYDPEELPENFPVILLKKSKKKYNRELPINRLLMYSLTKRQLLDELVEFIEEKQVKVCLFSLPSLAYVGGKNLEEKELFSKYTKMDEETRNNYRKDALRPLSKDPIFLEELLEEDAFKIKKDIEGIPYLSDIKGKYVNIKNGQRVIPDCPIVADKQIFIFGNSVVAGCYSDDSRTISNAAQVFLNEFHEEYGGPLYKVINISCGGHPNFVNMLKAVRHQNYQEGDVIVLGSWFSPLFEDNSVYQKRFKFFSPQKEFRVFDRPHKLGKYVWLDNIHFLPSANVYLGKLLGRALIQKERIGDEDSSLLGGVGDPNLSVSKYWMAIPPINNHTKSFARVHALTTKGKLRWLSFPFTESLKKDILYLLEIEMRSSNAVRFGAFIHDGETFERLDVKLSKSDEWETHWFFCRPKKENMKYFGLTATDFINAGVTVDVRSIKFQEALHLYD